MVKKEKKRKVVLASGTFDLLHLGHVRFLEEAKKAGGKDAELVVIVARDSTVKARKGKKPVMPEDQRRALVESLKVVDEAILGLEDFSIDKVIEKIKPDVIAVGHDQDGIEREVQKAIEQEKFDIEVVKIGRFGKRELDSSSKIMRKIIESFNNKKVD
jgi:FAD synthetase